MATAEQQPQLFDPGPAAPDSKTSPRARGEPSSSGPIWRPGSTRRPSVLGVSRARSAVVMCAYLGYVIVISSYI